ncbi:unnamed protein product [Symbiodinium sp. CCMP2592]|nr:unnamed protein product [Symbiodinium sp. CCMP2592]
MSQRRTSRMQRVMPLPLLLLALLCVAGSEDCGSEECVLEVLQPIRTCGEWCQGAESAKCLINQSLMPCRGSFCETNCLRWSRSVLADLRRVKVTCREFSDFASYPRGALICKEECLLPEIRPERYPLPTGVGLLCRPHSCDPAVQQRYKGVAWAQTPGVVELECPCNWFGSDCQDDWVPVLRVEKRGLGAFQLLHLHVEPHLWHRLMKDYRPGSIVRLQHLDANGVAREQPYALGFGSEGAEGSLEILTGPPPEGLNSVVVEVAHAVRKLTSGPVQGLFVNPAIAGFFNGHYRFLFESLASAPEVRRVVLVSSGVGLSGVKAALLQLLAKPLDWPLEIHLFYGLRDVRDLPYKEQLEAWVLAGHLSLTLLVSGQRQGVEGVLQDAVERGVSMAKMLASNADALPARLVQLLPSGRLYPQQALAIELAAGSLRSASLRDTAVVICGRYELLRDTPVALQAVSASSVFLRVSESEMGLLWGGSVSAGRGLLRRPRKGMLFALRHGELFEALKHPLPWTDLPRHRLSTIVGIDHLLDQEYMKWLFDQLEGPVYAVHGWEDRDDITVVDVPQDCIGYVTGNRRAALGGIEEEWGTLMFFMNKDGGSTKGRGRGGSEQLAIFGSERSRRGAELKVMSAVETKAPGTFTRGIREKFSDEKGFSTDRMIFRDDELSYALGRHSPSGSKGGRRIDLSLYVKPASG